jgi:hypothetical protein
VQHFGPKGCIRIIVLVLFRVRIGFAIEEHPVVLGEVHLGYA